MVPLRADVSVIRVRDCRHIVVYRRDDQCANWPFVGGLWRWDDGEIAVSFSTMACRYQAREDTEHGRIETFGEQRLARSFDDGQTWRPEDVTLLYRKPEMAQKLAFDLPKQHPSLDYRDPDTILRCHYVNDGIERRDLRSSFVLGSTDRGRTWFQGPVPLRADLFKGVQGLTQYLVRPDGLVLLFVEAHYRDPAHPQGLRPHIFASDDGGVWWFHYARLPVVEDPGYLYCHPGPVLLDDGRILCAVRKQFSGTMRCSHVTLYESLDGGRNWAGLGRLNDYGATPHLLRLRDGRIVCTYERRTKPEGIRARVSLDEIGHRWGPEIILRDDGGGVDLGYSRSVQRGDGQVMTFYYMNCRDDAIQCGGGVRHIAATIWTP